MHKVSLGSHDNENILKQRYKKKNEVKSFWVLLFIKSYKGTMGHWLHLVGYIRRHDIGKGWLHGRWGRKWEIDTVIARYVHVFLKAESLKKRNERGLVRWFSGKSHLPLAWDLSLIPRAPVMEEENWLLHVILWSPHAGAWTKTEWWKVTH